MAIFQSLVAARVIYVLGITNLVTGLLVFFTCRCLPGSRLGRKWMQHGRYQRFYRYHCYYWWAFWISVIVHAVFGIAFLGPV
ncbi:hypothetical protein ACFLTJ_04170 [Chloroflexota bacterium]